MTCTEAVAAAVWGAHGEQARPCRCETPGQRGKQESGSVRGYVRICASEQCPRQDSNLRSRLRRPFPCTALTCQNVLPDALLGRVSGTTRLLRLLGMPDGICVAAFTAAAGMVCFRLAVPVAEVCC